MVFLKLIFLEVDAQGWKSPKLEALLREVILKASYSSVARPVVSNIFLRLGKQLLGPRNIVLQDKR